MGVGGHWIDDPTLDYIKNGFDRYDAPMGSISAIRRVSTDPDLAAPEDKDVKNAVFDLGIATHDYVADENGDYPDTSYAFIYRREPYPEGRGGMLIWDPENDSDITIELEDDGGATWKLKPRHSVPIDFAVDFLHRFFAEGYIGDDLTWGP